MRSPISVHSGMVIFLGLLVADVAAAADGKIPITTASPGALKEFLSGRTLVENLRLTDAYPHFQKAVELDGGFALAHLFLSQTSPTAKAFFGHLDQAVTCAANASAGEQIWIKAFRAGAYADPATQRELYTELVGLFPGDERAQTLLGVSYFGQQQYVKAVEHLKRAAEIAPGFAPAYNQLGYAYRFLGRYPEAEAIFKKYTELLPGDPNPFDSYGELLLKAGRFDEAIVQYRKALAVNAQFTNSRTGIAAALMYQDRHADARAELQKALDLARTDGEKRAALFGMAVTYMDEGNSGQALRFMEKQYAIAENIKDAAAMAGDCTVMGNIFLQIGDPDRALAHFNRALALNEGSNLANEVKENAALIYHYNLGRIAVARGDLGDAGAHNGVFRKGVEAKENRNQARLVHELAGMIALAEKDYGRAVEEFKQGNQQDPTILYRLALACQGSGMMTEARAYATQAARFNGLPGMNSAYIRKKAEQLLATL